MCDSACQKDKGPLSVVTLADRLSQHEAVVVHQQTLLLQRGHRLGVKHLHQRRRLLGDAALRHTGSRGLTLVVCL